MLPPPLGIHVHVHAETLMHMEGSEDGGEELIEFEMESRIAKFLIQNFEDQKDAHHEIKGCFFARSSIYFRARI